MYQIPDGLPTLSRESHRPEDGRACVMEYVSVITGEAWSDHPTCTDPLIGSVAIALNDIIQTDADRSQIMVPFIGRLIGTTHNGLKSARLTYKHKLARVVRTLNPTRYDAMQMNTDQRCGCSNCHDRREQHLHYLVSSSAHRFTGDDNLLVVIPRLAVTLDRMLDIADEEFGRTKRVTDTQQRLAELVAELVTA